jgi:hypothetical protein
MTDFDPNPTWSVSSGQQSPRTPNWSLQTCGRWRARATDQLTTPRDLAGRLLEWGRGDPVALMLHLAGLDRELVAEAYRILEHELLPAQVAAEVDAEAARRGRYCTDDELAELERAAMAKPQRKITADDKARLDELVRQAAADVRCKYRNASRRSLSSWFSSD